MKKTIALPSRHVVELIPTAPFNFDATMHNPSHFPSGDNEWQPGVRRQTMRWQSTPLGLVFENCGTPDEPRVQLSIWSRQALDREFIRTLTAEINYRYNFQLDLAEFNARLCGDPPLAPLLERWRGMRPANYSSLYEYLIIAILLQNCTVRRSVQMMQALFEQYGTPLTFAGKRLYCFWNPGDLAHVTEEELRALKVGYRAKSILRVTQAFAQHEVDEFVLRSQSRDEQRAALLQLYGIGPASVGYILGDVFHRLDEMDHISPWEQKIYSKLFFDADPEEPVAVETLLRLFDERFSPYKMLAVHYVWSDLFWRRKNEPVEWLEKLIRL